MHQIKVSWALVNLLPLKFGMGFVFTHMISFRNQNPRFCSMDPILKILWYEPITQRVPLSLKTLLDSFSQRIVNLSYSSKP